MTPSDSGVDAATRVSCGGCSSQATHRAFEAKDAQMLARIVKEALRDELSAVQIQLLELRSLLQPPPPARPSEADGGRCQVMASGTYVTPPSIPPQRLPGMVLDQAAARGDDREDDSGDLWQSYDSPILTPMPTVPRARRSSVGIGASIEVSRSGRSQSQGRTSISNGPGDVLNAGAVKNRAVAMKRRQTRFPSSVRMPEGVPAAAAGQGVRSIQLDVSRDERTERGKFDSGSSAAGEGFQQVVALKPWVLAIVRSTAFDVAVCIALFVNAIFIGVQANQSASQREAPAAYAAVDLAFCVVFTAELALRMFALGRLFFSWGEWWNYFDLVVVTLQLIEEITIVSVRSSEVMLSNMSGMRMLRIIRLLRILRVLRVIRFISELKKIVYLIIGSLPSFFWAMVLLSLLIYVLAVFFTQLVADSYVPADEGSVLSEHWEALSRKFGSTMTSALTLYKAVSGGVDWEEISTPIIEYISPFVGAIFVMYSLFAVLVLLNLVTGVFVDGAMRLSQADKEVELFERACKLLKRTDQDGSGDITWSEFKGRLSSPEMWQFFEALEISMSRAGDLFQIIDSSNDGRLNLEELVAGGLMLQGPAKAIDVAALNKYLHGALDQLREEIHMLRHKYDRDLN